MMMMNRMIKKAALGGPSSDETFPLREKTKFYVLLLAAAKLPGIPYFLEISPRRDFISRLRLVRRLRGRLDFEGGVYRDRYARSYTASIISLVVCT